MLKKSAPSCAIESTLRMISGKWKLIILWYLTNEKMRYSELKRVIPAISEKMLIQSLKQLEKDGLIIRKMYPVIPPRTEYSLSSKGKSLQKLLKDLDSWSQKYQR